MHDRFVLVCWRYWVVENIRFASVPSGEKGLECCGQFSPRADRSSN